jgi:methyl-accepting chemotaxis protein WspA
LRRNLLANWEKSMKFMIGTKIFAGYTIAFLAIVTLSTVSYLSHQHLNASYLKGRSLRDLSDRIDQVHDFVSDGYQGQQIFLITGKGTGLTKLDETVAGLDQKIGGMRTVAGAEKYGTEIAKLEVAAKSLLNLLKTESATREAAALAGSVERAAGELEQFYLLSETFKMLVMREFNAVEQQTDLASGSLEHVILFGTPLALVFIGIIGLVVSRNITVALSRIEGVASRMAEGDFTATLQDTGRGDEIGSLARCLVAMNKALADLITQVQRSGLQVNSSAIEIAATTKQQQSTASEVATTSAEISATAKEMSATSSELLKTADNVSTVAEQASELAADGKSGLVRMESIMHGILDASAAISAKLGVMNEKAGNITAPNTLATVKTTARDARLLRPLAISATATHVWVISFKINRYDLFMMTLRILKTATWPTTTNDLCPRIRLGQAQPMLGWGYHPNGGPISPSGRRRHETASPTTHQTFDIDAKSLQRSIQLLAAA